MKKTITIQEAADRMGVSQQFLRLALQQEKFPFGKAVKMKNWRYYINPVQLEHYLSGGDTDAKTQVKSPEPT